MLPLAVSTPKRAAMLPDVPTIAEAGYPAAQYIFWGGIAVPAKTPQAAIDRLNKEINAALARPDVKQKLADLGMNAQGGTPAQLQQVLVADIKKWGEVIERAKIPKQ